MRDVLLDAPIPGMSLTHELGNRPWQSPPKASSVGEAMETYLPAFESEEVVPQIINVLESGIPVATIAEATMLGGVMEGRHTIDVGILILPFLMEMIAYVGDLADIEYSMGTTKVKVKNAEMTPPTEQEISVAKKRLDEAKENIEIEDAPIEEEEEPQGLMARRQ
tara:strand:- start:414 stop:908 length:495 start_codon:yes stop_codon:yes gene_type:complete